jgi:hypothetical protein
MELVVDANNNTEGDDLDLLNEELTPFHLELKGDFVTTTTHIKRSLFPMFCYVLLPSFP